MIKMLKRISRPRYRLYISSKILWTILKKSLSGKAFKGKCIAKFERKFREYIGTRYAVAVPMARTAFYLILDSLNLKEGDEIITSTYTIPEVINMILCCKLKPVFVDIDPYTYNMDPREIEKSITKRTKAILLTHLYGQPCEIDKINRIAKKYNLITIEDCAQSCGAAYKNKMTGNCCDVGYFSFSSYKNITTFFGGMVTTNNKKLAKNIQKKIENYHFKPVMLYKRILRDLTLLTLTSKCLFPLTFICISIINKYDDTLIDRFLSTKPELKKEIPKEYLIKYSNLQAAIGIEQLKRIDRLNNIRINNAHFYQKHLKSIKGITLQKIIPHTKSIYLNFPVRVKNRKKLLKRLFNHGIDTTAGHLPVCSEMTMFKEYRKKCPNAVNVSKEIIYLPIQPDLTKEELSYIINVIKNESMDK